MYVLRWSGVLLLALTLAVVADNTGIDSTNKSAWAENAGWLNAAPTNGAVVHFDESSGYLTGYTWGENIGWIKLGDDTGGPYANTGETDWGVNLDSDGNLSGYAWGENVGWISFSNAYAGVSINPSNGLFEGEAWGENIGWIRFPGDHPDYGVRTWAFDLQSEGTPNWWLDHHNVSELDDEGDGVPAWREYYADTDPNDASSFLLITAVSNALTAPDIVFSPTSTRRYYTLDRREDLSAGSWSNVVSQADVQGTGSPQVLQDTTTATQMFYRVQVEVSP